MAGALSLQEDILALVKKHGDTCLPEDLLARLAEEARLLAVREQIRALHEADRFGLFSEPSAEQESDGDEEDDGAEDAEQDGGGGGGAGQDKEGQTLVLPDNVKRMLSSMKVTRLDKVAALNGFTTIDAEVEFSLNNAATTSTASPPPPPGKAASSQPATEVAEGAPSPPSEPPVYLLFRFRRESLPKSPDSSSSDSGSDSDSGEDSDADDVFITGVAGPRKTSSVTVVNLSDEEEEDKVGGSRKSAVVVGKKDRRKGSGSCSSGNSSSRDGGMTGKAGGGGAPEGRKRASSGNGGDTRRKRPKGGGEEDGEEEAEEEAPERGESKGCMEEVCQTGQTGCCGDGSEADGVGLAFDPRTLVSYTICGGVGYDQPNVLLQAVVYARGDGPACVMPSPVGVASHEGDEEAMSASDTSDQDDVFDCNVDGPALAAVGRALGLHTADSEDDGQDQHEGRSSLESEGRGGKSAKHDGGMTVSDLVWWVMLFPFFEKEFDMVEVVASSVFGEDGSDSDDGEGKDDNESSDDGEPGA